MDSARPLPHSLSLVFFWEVEALSEDLELASHMRQRYHSVGTRQAEFRRKKGK